MREPALRGTLTEQHQRTVPLGVGEPSGVRGELERRRHIRDCRAEGREVSRTGLYQLRDAPGGDGSRLPGWTP
ncbi:hypothetical protein GCM10010272_49120 [Streptomyces lateritius]|nr:hypothetical protein GCM10010272_49120 [Streptomyces lateritius]